MKANAQLPAAFHRRLAALAVLISAVTLGVSYSLPTVTFRAILKPVETYSIWGGIESLWEDGNFILAPTVFLFSMVFPIGKLVALTLLLAGTVREGNRVHWLRWLHLLGKWSMLDVFIVGVFVAAVQLGFVADASSRWGIHVFALSIVMSMGCTWYVARVFGGHGTPRPAPALRSSLGRALAAGRALGLAAMFALPLLEVTKVLLRVETSNEVHLWRTTRRLAREGELLLALALGLFVIGLPILRALLALRLRWLGGDPRRSLALALGLDAWAMVDVFGLGLLIVQVKLAELTTTHLLAGFWATLVAAILAQLDSWHLRRAALARDR